MPILAPIRCAFLNELRILAGSTPQLQQRKDKANCLATLSSASLSQMHNICTSCAQTCNICKSSSPSSTNDAIQRSDVNQNAPHAVQHRKSIGGFISRPDIAHRQSAASSQTPSPNDVTSSIVAHQGQTGAKYCRAITIQLANASKKSPRDSVASCSASLRSLISNAQLITHRCSHTSHTSPRRTARHGAVSAHRGSVDRAAGADTQSLCQGAPATVQLQVMLFISSTFVLGLACERAARAICSFPPLDATSGTH